MRDGVYLVLYLVFDSCLTPVLYYLGIERNRDRMRNFLSDNVVRTTFFVKKMICPKTRVNVNDVQEVEQVEVQEVGQNEVQEFEDNEGQEEGQFACYEGEQGEVHEEFHDEDQEVGQFDCYEGEQGEVHEEVHDEDQEVGHEEV